MRGGAAFLAILISGGVAVLQSTILGFISIRGVEPDLALIVVVFVANRNGSMFGQLAGFGAGLVLDIMGTSPLGLYALIFAVIGAVFGATRGKIFVDPVFMPMLFAIAATLIKGAMGLLLGGLFGIAGLPDAVISSGYALELGFTAVLCPVVFGILRLVGPLQPERRRGEGF